MDNDDRELWTLASSSYGPDCSPGCISPSHLSQLPRMSLFIFSVPRRTAHSHTSTKQGKTKSAKKKCAVAMFSRTALWGEVRERPACHSVP